MRVSLPIIAVASIFACSPVAGQADPNKPGPVYHGTVKFHQKDDADPAGAMYCFVPGQGDYRCPCLDPSDKGPAGCLSPLGTVDAPCSVGGNPTINNLNGVADSCS
ncbi:hypothetical protein P3342_011183 [Pyrenophora teres f. teres]|uniref:Uncharacterized protein n=1 Tax=Pyrenophora teres f. teres TaxID=97479 RepID=A0A6S6WI73_9PLEO|nr:hypothetical protein PTNB85_09360 [Pyrenophora teres f. teres]KAE8831966.1 hypothetical protein HRS9139_06208 [Pyrenophora teres f. teres]KAE8835297.1 hypothetical protein HRS9122_07567 [Pyrenophora teres f. teres]KAE8858198.1 hypothetical protein PTNB29_07413 [Pyrenophora teres f. teres]KAE8861964.1 hypothetical protein PTNB73_07518 [Pyrenophora teres f. teres]